MTMKYETHEPMYFGGGGDAYRSGWDRVFGKKEEPRPIPTREDLEAHAKKHGISVNPSEKVVEEVLRGLAKRQGLCPCRIPNPDPVERQKQLCPCAMHLDEIEKSGACHCHLFVRSEG